MSKSRLTKDDNVINIIAKMSEGNFGALQVLSKIFEANNIEPDKKQSGLEVATLLDKYEIYGYAIPVLYFDICKGDLGKTIAVIRAVELGFFDQTILHTASYRQDYTGAAMVPVDHLYQVVKEKNPRFDLYRIKQADKISRIQVGKPEDS